MTTMLKPSFSNLINVNGDNLRENTRFWQNLNVMFLRAATFKEMERISFRLNECFIIIIVLIIVFSQLAKKRNRQSS